MERIKPKSVRDAQLVGDHDTLSRMGREGARQRQLNRNRRKKQSIAMILKGIQENRYAANEHILTPDGEEGEFPDGIIPGGML